MTSASDINKRPPTVREVGAALDAWADPRLAAPYDNVGLHIGHPKSRVHSGLVALDLAPQVVDEAIELGVSIVVTHHPLLFHPLRSMTTGDLVGGMALRLAEARIALYSAHTNLDAVPHGVSMTLANRLGVSHATILKPNDENGTGFGAVGDLPSAVTLADLLGLVSKRLESSCLRYVGDQEQQIQRIAVCGGAGASLIREARTSGADVYITSDLSYHQFFEVLSAQGDCIMALIDAGHYETERHTEALLCAALKEFFPQVSWHRTAHRTSPINTFTANSEH